MNLLSWAVFGLLAGAIAKLIMPGKDPGGCLVTMILGVAGALIGGFIGANLLGFGRVDGFNLRSLAIAILGAIVVLTLYRLLLSRRRPR